LGDPSSSPATVTPFFVLAATEAADILSFSVQEGFVLAATEQPDVASFNVQEGFRLSATEAADAAAFTLVEGANLTLAATEGADIIAFTIQEGFRLSATEAADVAVVALLEGGNLALAAVEAGDVAAFDMAAATAADFDLAAGEAADAVAFQLEPAAATSNFAHWKIWRPRWKYLDTEAKWRLFLRDGLPEATPVTPYMPETIEPGGSVHVLPPMLEDGPYLDRAGVAQRLAEAVARAGELRRIKAADAHRRQVETVIAEIEAELAAEAEDENEIEMLLMAA
jgi:hypothetical protein